MDFATGSTLTNWRRGRGDPSLSEVHRTIAVASHGSMWRKLVSFLGPGYLVAVGYMDPGNWATSLAGGAKFGYALLFIALLSNIMAIVLQHLCARMAVATGRDLAQACRDAYPRALSYPLWFLAEIAICATDLAEVIGTAIGLNLLFGVPLEIGVIITAADVFLILYLQNKGFRWIEAFIITLLGVIAVCFVVQIAMADPDWGQVIRGFAPTTQIVTNPDMLYLSLGIIGATVMPHNLYLHSGIVQTRAFGHTLAGEARGGEARHHRLDHGAHVRADDQRLDPDPRRGGLQQERQHRSARSSTRRTRCSRRCSAPPWPRPCSASPSCAAASTRP